MLDALKQGRDLCRRREWDDAYKALSLADQASPLSAEDLELLATSAYLTGRDLEFQRILDRAHLAYLAGGNHERAARCAFWLCLGHLLRGEEGAATGWLSRARRLIELRDCVEQGYLLLPVAEQALAGDNGNAAYADASRATEIADRFGDADLAACARHLQGRALIGQGKVHAGLALLDEAMLAVVREELSPIMTGLIYCSVIDVCLQVYALRRAREWTDALAGWCDRQPGMVAFKSTCRVHRAEVMRLHGAWPDAMAEAGRACERFSQLADQPPPAAAFYQQGEMYRLRGDFAAAEEAYRAASRSGWEPQPGLALLRMAQGRVEGANAAIRRVLSSRTGSLERAKLLPAHVEILLAAGDLGEARRACCELEQIAKVLDANVLGAIAAQARGALELAEGNAQAALASLSQAFEVWQQLEAPYETARVRVLLGMACLALGDSEGSDLQFGAARAVFEKLGAGPELARLDSLTRRATSAPELTPRERQVLRLVAAGKSNKIIAAELSLSGRTVDRHVSNILNKLNVPSRAAATAYAYEHKLF